MTAQLWEKIEGQSYEDEENQPDDSLHQSLFGKEGDLRKKGAPQQDQLVATEPKHGSKPQAEHKPFSGPRLIGSCNPQPHHAGQRPLTPASTEVLQARRH
jgi:hypothetical protein